MLIGVAIVGALLVGARLGTVRALPLAGFAVGALIGTRLPLLIGVELESSSALVAALPAALLLGALIAALAEARAPRLPRALRRRGAIDGAGGAVMAAAAAVVVVWMLAPSVAEVPAVREHVIESDVIGRLNAAVTPAGPALTEALPPIDNLPRYAGRGPDVAPGDPALLFDPDVVAAERSVARILVAKCDGLGSGTGWVAAAGIVATNAHVVAGGQRIIVQPRGSRRQAVGVPIWFDGEHDIALLRVTALRGLRALPMVREPRAGTAGASLGFPLGRWAIRRARLGPTTDRIVARLGGRPSPGVSDLITGRLVTTIRGRLQPGNSGGPVVDGQGRVLTTAFAGGAVSSSLGVPNRFVRAGLRRAGPRVSLGRCR
ncbi:MAG: trypsin-like peptidase domain-containing protein [Solirubrobacteraceae bacterium]|nr:trypsin-like peptidase domain-containing protein [Solirubrobacteraceae bacterium]